MNTNNLERSNHFSSMHVTLRNRHKANEKKMLIQKDNFI